MIDFDAIEKHLLERLEELGVRYGNLLSDNITPFKYGRGAVVHELIKTWLVNYGESIGFIAWPEYKPRIDAGGQKVDVVYLESGKGVIAGFEIDKAVKNRSAAKLNRLGDDVVKCVVSFGSGRIGSGKPERAEQKARVFGLHRIDLTESKHPAIWGNLRRGESIYTFPPCISD